MVNSWYGNNLVIKLLSPRLFGVLDGVTKAGCEISLFGNFLLNFLTFSCVLSTDMLIFSLRSRVLRSFMVVLSSCLIYVCCTEIIHELMFLGLLVNQLGVPESLGWFLS